MTEQRKIIQEQEAAGKAYRHTAIVHMSIIFAAVAYIFIAWSFRDISMPMPDQALGIFRAQAYVIYIFAWPAMLYVGNAVMKRPTLEGQTIIAKLQGASVVKASIVHTPAVFALIIVLATKNYLEFGLAITYSTILQILCFPKFAEWQRDNEQQIPVN